MHLDILIRSASVCEQFPAGHSEGPDVTLVCEDSLRNAFQGQPFNGHLATMCLVFILIEVEQLGQSKVSDLDTVGSLDQNIPGCQVSVDQPHVLKMSHATSNLSAPVEQRLGANLVLVVPHIVQQTAQGHQLGDQHHLTGHADGQHLEQVGVLHRGHDLGLVQDLILNIDTRALSQHLDSNRDLDIFSLRNPDTFEDCSEGTITKDAPLSQVLLLDNSELRQVGFDVGGSKRFIGVVS